MDREEVRRVVKQMIAKVTDLDPATIPDNASFREDLEIDSLAMIEIGVHVDFEYKLKLTEDEMGSLATIDDTVELVLRKQAQQGTPPAGA